MEFEYLEVVADSNRMLKSIYRLQLDRFGLKVGDPVFPDVANKLGLRGWELVSVIKEGNNFLFYFKCSY